METDLAAAKSTTHSHSVLPSPSTIAKSRKNLHSTLPQIGQGTHATNTHLQTTILPALNRSSQSPNYYGFVTGGCTPAAAFADNLVTETDQNVQVHLPDETLATDVEDCALRMVCGLLRLEVGDWGHRIFTTGATASNVVGLGCGREFVVAEAARRGGEKGVSVAEEGILGAMRAAGVEEVVVLATVPHSSLRKAVSVVGLGRSSVVDVGRVDAKHLFDFKALEEQLARRGRVCIVAVSAAEVNTGFFATQNYDDMAKLRKLCDEYGAWLHIDAAFGLLARVLPPGQGYDKLIAGVAGLELADSITGDAHKMLNVVSKPRSHKHRTPLSTNNHTSPTTAVSSSPATSRPPQTFSKTPTPHTSTPPRVKRTPHPPNQPSPAP